jgi:outer membrane protein OmpA-like peptidoglycan-associated protein
MKELWRWVGWLSMALVALGCSAAPKLRGKIAGLEKIVEQAERNGAMRCAPRELAVARSNLRFASIELDQGYVSKAQNHLWKAESNAHAALDMSPPQYCAERGFVEAPRPFVPDDPDTDGDGLLDSVDQCILEPEDKDQYLDEDGCPEIDNDLDTILDVGDKCPNEAEDPDGFEDADGCPEPDNDKDTVLDVKDQCPNEVGSTTQEPLGCPAKPALAVITDCEVKIAQQIHFEYNKDKIRPESFPILDAVVEILNKNPDVKLEVQGHTDNRGSASYNKDLSNRRSASVRKYLAGKGIASDRLTSAGYGFDRPIVDNSTEQNRALNRRVQFVRTEGVKEGCPKTGVNP